MSAPSPAAKTAPSPSTFKARVLGRLASWLMRLLCFTLRIRFDDRAGLQDRDPTAPVIICFWHNCIFIMPVAWKRRTRNRRSSAVLTSASRDGGVLAETMRAFGFGSVRGSTSRRGAQALVECRRLLRAGTDVTITPDGPRGPACKMAPGPIQLARVTGVPVLPVTVQYGNAWRLKSWDRFQIPRPFSRVTVTFHPVEQIGEDVEAERLRLEALLNSGGPPP